MQTSVQYNRNMWFFLRCSTLSLRTTPLLHRSAVAVQMLSLIHIIPDVTCCSETGPTNFQRTQEKLSHTDTGFKQLPRPWKALSLGSPGPSSKACGAQLARAAFPADHEAARRRRVAAPAARPRAGSGGGAGGSGARPPTAPRPTPAEGRGRERAVFPLPPARRSPAPSPRAGRPPQEPAGKGLRAGVARRKGLLAGPKRERRRTQPPTPAHHYLRRSCSLGRSCAGTWWQRPRRSPADAGTVGLGRHVGLRRVAQKPYAQAQRAHFRPRRGFAHARRSPVAAARADRRAWGSAGWRRLRPHSRRSSAGREGCWAARLAWGVLMALEV